jgi:tetratricopeptide (TPR) repeat protein
MDAGGVGAAKPLYESAKATYITLVDSQNQLGDALGFKVIPNGFLIDEAGFIRGQQVGGFEVSSPKTIQAVEAFLARPPAALTKNAPIVSDEERELALRTRLLQSPDSEEANLELGKLLFRRGKTTEALPFLETAARATPKSSSAVFTTGTALLAIGRKEAALARFREALKLDPANYVVRKQIWLIEHPERFHPTIDWAWQREQLAKERERERAGASDG